MKNKTLIAHLAVLIVNLIYSGNYFIAKGIMPTYLSPNFFILLRIGGAFSLFWIIKFFIKETIHKKDYWRIALCGLFGISMNQLLFFQGLSITSAVDASIIMTSTPILVSIFSFLILKNPFTINKVVGITLGLAGAIYLIVLGSKETTTESSLLGNLLVLGNASSYSVYLVLVKPLMSKYKPITVITWVFSFGLLYTLPFGLAAFDESSFNFGWDIVLGIIYVVLFTTFFAYLLNIYGLSILPPTAVSAYIYLQPVFAMIIGIIIAYNQDTATGITFEKMAATLLIFVGVYLVGRSRR